jgi:tryptophan synthase alpha chain
MNQTRAQRRSISQVFAEHKSRGEIGLVPFIPAGYPDLPATAALLPALEQAGATVIEVGFPFSDPIADGPVIQEAFVDALARKVKIAQVFSTVASVRDELSLPWVAMLSYSIVFRFGVERFVKEAKAAGFDGLILPDLPPPEARRICGIIRNGGLDTILLVAPTTTDRRREEIVRLSSGFVYYLSVSGITGERDQLPTDLARNVRQLKGMTDLPVCVGFGISQPRHVAQLAQLADGAIVGTAIVRRIKAHAAEGSMAIAEAIGTYTRELLSEVRPAQEKK